MPETQTRKRKRNSSEVTKRSRCGFSLNDTMSLGLQQQLNACTLLVGLGTTGTLITDGIARRIGQQTGKLPSSLDYLTLDGAAASGLFDPMRHRTLGVNGCGTDPNEGRRAFEKAYSELRRVFDRMFFGLNPNAPGLPASVSPRECIEAWVIAGNGGSSGGMQQPAITLLNDVLRKRGVKEVRVNCIFLGADMPVQDATRTTTDSQVETVAQTAWANLRRYLADHMNPIALPQSTASGDFTIPAGQRVWSVNVMDQSNGHFQIGKTSDLIEMVAASYFAAICTHCATSVEDRWRDLEVLGDTARAFAVSHAIV